MAGDLVPMRARGSRRRVVVTFPLPDSARAAMTSRLGPGVELVDIKVSDGEEDIVLVPSSSRQLTGKLRKAFPHAALVVVEVEDAAHGIALGGQVIRTLDAGADGYFVARSVDELASIVDHAVGRAAESASPPPAALAAGGADQLDEVLDALIEQRSRQR